MVWARARMPAQRCSAQAQRELRAQTGVGKPARAGAGKPGTGPGRRARAEPGKPARAKVGRKMAWTTSEPALPSARRSLARAQTPLPRWPTWASPRLGRVAPWALVAPRPARARWL